MNRRSSPRLSPRDIKEHVNVLKEFPSGETTDDCSRSRSRLNSLQSDDIGTDDTTDMNKTKDMKKKKKKKSENITAIDYFLDNPDLTSDQFRKHGKAMVDFIADYLEGSRKKPVNHSVQDGFLLNKLPQIPPNEPSTMGEVLKEVEEVIFPGIPQWQSPQHHALLPAGGSYASLLGSILCDGLGCIGLTWGECPASAELEMIVMNWLATLMDLPKDFHFFGKSNFQADGGGGMIQGSTTENLLTIVVAAKRIMIKSLGLEADANLAARMVVYCSEQAHPSIERIAEVVGIRVKRLWTDSKGVMHADVVRVNIIEDKKNGQVPFLVIGTMGTVATTSVDQIMKIGPVCKKFEPRIWFHVESGYAGSSFICREYQPLLKGVQYADSFSMSAHKWLPVHMDCACLWVRKCQYLTLTFNCEDPDGPLTIPSEIRKQMAEYRQWSLPMTRRFRAMKLWMVFKLIGTKGLQMKIRQDVRRAKEFEKLVKYDPRFEIIEDTMFGIVPFRIQDPYCTDQTTTGSKIADDYETDNQLNNDINKSILENVNSGSEVKMTGASVGSKFWLRYVVAGKNTAVQDVAKSWDVIRDCADKVIHAMI